MTKPAAAATKAVKEETPKDEVKAPEVVAPKTEEPKTEVTQASIKKLKATTSEGPEEERVRSQDPRATFKRGALTVKHL